MNGFYELHFHGNRQEIEKEKLRKRELMSYFPKTLGTVDETIYVLQDDEKPNFGTPFGELNVDATPLIISNDSEKSKERQNNSPTNMPSYDSNAKTVNFDVRKENTNQKKAKEYETKAPKYPFDFDSANPVVTNKSFNLNNLYRGLETVKRDKPRTTGVKSDSLGLERQKIENVADSLKTVNVNNNTNTVSNNTVTTKPYIKPGLYGKNPDRDYTEDLRKIKQELPPIAASILNNSGTEIVVLDNMFSVDENGVVTPRIGRYYANKNKIYIDSWHVDKRTLLSEAIHAVQDYLGMTGTGKSNLEFQEHVIKDLYYHHKYRKTKDIEYLNGISTTESKDYIYLINNALDEKGVLDLNKFLSEINYYFDKFQSHYKKSDSYQTQGVKNFNYNWIKLLHIFDIEYKY